MSEKTGQNIQSETGCESVWGGCLEYLRGRVPSQTYDTWFRPIKALSINGDQLFLQVPNKFFYEWIDSHYRDILERALKKVTGNGIKIKYTVLISEDKSAKGVPESPDPQAPAEFDAPAPTPDQISTDYKAQTGIFERGSKINHNYIFARFIEGKSNQFAKAAAVAVANSPGRTSFNPLVIYGGTGLGKTHLIQAIGNESLKNRRAMRVVYVSSDTFTLDFIAAIQKNKSTEFSKYYRGIDMLLLDDIQFFQGKESTQEQFFHIFNSLYQHHKQVVLTTDKHPLELKGLQERMLSRFQAGLTVDIQPPDLETRIAILKRKADEDNLDIPYAVIEHLARNIRSNIRELEGAMIRLLAYSSLLRVDIDIPLTQKVLKEILGNSKAASVSIEDIQDVLKNRYNISLDLLVGKSRKKEVAEARMIAMYFARKHTSLSLKSIGLYFGGRDHSTVVHACKWVESKLETDEGFSRQLARIGGEIETTIS